MPTFDFQCRKCDHVFEFSRPFGSDEKPSCAECQGETEKLIAPPAIHFKGQGFYKTDSDKKETKDSKEIKETKDSKAPEASTETKNTTNTEKKADSPKKSKD